MERDDSGCGRLLSCMSAFEQAIAKDDWDSLTPRVDNNTHRLLDIFAEHNVKATFFVLGWVAQRCPALIQRIAAEGHELGSHGTNHARLTTLTQQQAYEDIAQSKDRIEQISGKAVMGYRAPSFSINAKTEYVYDILARLGFMYFVVYVSDRARFVWCTTLAKVSLPSPFWHC